MNGGRLLKNKERILLDEKFPKQGNFPQTSTREQKYQLGQSVVQEFREKLQYLLHNTTLLDNHSVVSSLVTSLEEMIGNSVDANATSIRVVMKHNQDFNRIFCFIADNGEGKEAAKTAEKRKSGNFLGKHGCGIDTIKTSSAGTFKLFRNKKGATASFLINLDTHVNDSIDYLLRKALVDEDITQTQFDQYILANEIIKTIHTNMPITDEKFLDKISMIFGKEVCFQYGEGILNVEEFFQKHLWRIVSFLSLK